MSNLETTSSAEEEVVRPSSNDTETSLERKVGIAKQFDKEMKDYAKATVKEFLGIYGYEEDVDINMDDSGDNQKTDTTAAKTDTHTESTSSVSNQQTSQSQRDRVSSTAASGMSTCNVERATNEHVVTSVSISSSTTNRFRNSPQQFGELLGHSEWSSSFTREGGDSVQEKSVFDNSNESLAPCRWCKKLGRLQNFTYIGDQSRVVYEGLCSAVCFESVTRIRQGKEVGAISSTYFNHDNPMSTFSWDIYLNETNGTAAPWACFKQSSAPPFNGFQCGMKLEAADPRNEGTACVATVVGILGSRLRLRFDGCDNSNDIWRMVDSGDIHPIGWCEGNGGVLQPPVGFRSYVGKFSNFLTKTLANGELAPLRLFKKEPHPPKNNFFAPSHKLEAVDLKNPVLICVATVVEVVGDHIIIVFDGWKGSKYTYRYDSRDIFPVGWCYFSGHPLQPPGPEYIKARRSSADKHPMFSPAVRPLEVPGQSPYPQQSHSSPALVNADSASDALAEYSPRLAVARLSLRVELFVNQGCHFGSYLDPVKVAQLPQVFRGRIGEVLKEGIQAIVNAAFNPKTVLGFLQPGKGKVVITAHCGRDTYSCCLQNVDRVSVVWNIVARFTDNLRCCKNFFSSSKVKGICRKCQKQGSKTTTKKKQVLDEKNERNEVELIPRNEPPKKARRISTEEIDNDIGSTSSPTTWSTDEVVKYFKTSDISQYAEVFRDHEIDGGALLLLNRETVMSCMQFKLGPALKLLNHISQLKARFGL